MQPTPTLNASAYPLRPVAARRAFVVAPYIPGEDGTFEPRWPPRCPCGVDDPRPCRLVRSHRRARKTGPETPLAVLLCLTHGHAFTVYPPGHVPYGREPIVRLGLDGGRLVGEAGTDPASATFDGTFFDCARDAARGEAWERTGAGCVERSWQTQRRRLALAMRWLAVAPVLADTLREAAAEALAVPLLLLADRAKRVRESPGYRARGQAVWATLEDLVRGGRAVDRLADAGYLAELWGRPLRLRRWGVLRPCPFSRPGTRAPPGPSGSVGRSHESET